MRPSGSNPDLAVHGRLVGRYAAMTARQLGIPRASADRLRLAGELHGIGKPASPASILDKPAEEGQADDESG